MKKLLALLSAVCLVFIFSGVSHADQYSWTTLDYPGAVETFAGGIDGSNIVGAYQHTVGRHAKEHGFLYDGTTWTRLNDPDATGYGTEPHAIDGSNIVGVYWDADGNTHGFLYDKDTDVWTTLDDPDADTTDFYDTWVNGISGSYIVGNYMDVDGNTHGFLYDKDTNVWTTLDDPDATDPQGTVVNGIDGSYIVGSYEGSDGNTYGFLCDVTDPDAPSFTQLFDSDAGDATNNQYDIEANGISGSNIVGSYEGSDGNWHGFLYNKDTEVWTIPFDDPDTYYNSTSLGIDDSNIVGSYEGSDGNWHGFLAQPECGYTISPDTVTVKSKGGHVRIDVTATTGIDACPAPDVVINVPWITLFGTRWKDNSGTLVFDVQKNTTSQIMIGTVDIGDKTLTIDQDAASTGK